MADATAYLLERKGDVPGALALALRTLSARLASLRTALQAASLRDVAAEMAFMVPGSPSKRPLTGEGDRPVLSKSMSGSGLGGFGGGAGGGNGGAPRAGTAAWARWASKVALEGLQEVRVASTSLLLLTRCFLAQGSRIRSGCEVCLLFCFCFFRQCVGEG